MYVCKDVTVYWHLTDSVANGLIFAYREDLATYGRYTLPVFTCREHG